MNYDHIKKPNYHFIDYVKDGVRRAVLLPADTKSLEEYFTRLQKANTQKPEPTPGTIETAVA